MPARKYQSIDNDPDSEPEPALVPAPATSPVEPPIKMPRKYKNKYLVEPEKVVEAIKSGHVELTNKQVRKLIPKAPREKRVVSEEERARLLAQLQKGRETIAKNKLLHGNTAKQELEQRKKELIAEKMITLVKPPKGKPKNKKAEPAPEPAPVPAPDTEPPKLRRVVRRTTTPNNYPSDTETDGDTTDTRQIKRVRRKIKLVRDVPAASSAVKSYSDMSLIEKLNLKI